MKLTIIFINPQDCYINSLSQTDYKVLIVPPLKLSPTNNMLNLKCILIPKFIPLYLPAQQFIKIAKAFIRSESCYIIIIFIHPWLLSSNLMNYCKIKRWIDTKCSIHNEQYAAPLPFSLYINVIIVFTKTKQLTSQPSCTIQNHFNS